MVADLKSALRGSATAIKTSSWKLSLLPMRNSDNKRCIGPGLRMPGMVQMEDHRLRTDDRVMLRFTDY